jgi:hypothetical protein
MLTVDWNRNDETGPVAAAKIVFPQEEVVFVTQEYEMERVSVEEIPELDRASWGWLVTKENALVETEKDPIVRIVCLRRDGRGSSEDDEDESGEDSEESEIEKESEERVREEAAPEESDAEQAQSASEKTLRARRTRRSTATRTPQRRRSR